MLLMPVVFIAIVVFAILGGVLRVAVPLILGAAALRSQRAAMTAMLPIVANSAVQNTTPQPVFPPHVVLPPVPPSSTGGNTYMPGGPAVVGGQIFVPGVTPKWPR
jgi:hypothetical protein